MARPEEQVPLSQTRSRDLANLIIDFEDESCPSFDLHLSAYQGDHLHMREILKDPQVKSHIDDRIRPFLSTPLRLAATAGNVEALRVLIENGASIEVVDVKSQTALFVALVHLHWDCVEYLLSVGANPNGSDSNLCTPLSIMAQRGYYEGVKLLCSWGADTEDFYRLLSGLPSLPLTICTTYRHFKVFSLLLLFGARTDLGPSYRSSHPMIVNSDKDSVSGTVFMFRQIIERCSVPHTIIKHKCPPEFVYLYYEFGGNLWIKDSVGMLATEISLDAPGLSIMKTLQETPMSLQSICRLSICRSLSHDLDKIKSLPLNPKLISFLLYTEIANSINQIPKFDNSAETVRAIRRTLSEIVADGPKRLRGKPPSRPLPVDWFVAEKVKTVTLECDDSNNKDEYLEMEPGAKASNIPIPPPLPPSPARPHFIKLPSERS